jgi:hypothetical protein
MFRSVLLVIAVAFLTSACAALGGYPNNPTTTKDEMKALSAYFDPAEILQYKTMPAGAARQAFRDEVVYGRLAAYDIEFSQFQQDINAERGLTDTTGDLTTLTLTALGATGLEAGTKTALSAAATAVNGGKASVDKNIFYDQTLPVLFAQMAANRATIRYTIEKGLSVPPPSGDASYPLTAALVDLAAYRDAGSIPGAITGVAVAAGAQKAHFQGALIALRSH